MSSVFRWLRKLLVALVVAIVLLLLVTRALRWFADDDAARADLALMEASAPAPAGRNGSAWLALADLEIPEAEVEAAFAEDVAAFAAWQAGAGKRLFGEGDLFAGVTSGSAEAYVSPLAGRYRERPRVQAPEAACTLAAADCLARVRAEPETVRAWLAADAARLALATHSLEADHVAYPYAPAIDSPLPSYQHWRLPLSAAALQAVDGDAAGALVRACGLLASARRLGGGADMLISKLVAMSLTEGAAGLVLAIQREHPGLALPAGCAPARAPVQVDDYQVCEALRFEYRMNAQYGRLMDEGLAGRWDPMSLAYRWLLLDERMHKLWVAETFAPACRDDFRSAVAAGDVPALGGRFVRTSEPRCYAAFGNCLLTGIAAPAWDGYQTRLLDHAARLRLLLAGIARQAGEIDASAFASAAASPGYAVSRREDGWHLPLKNPRQADQPDFVLPHAPAPADPAAAPTAPAAGAEAAGG